MAALMAMTAMGAGVASANTGSGVATFTIDSGTPCTGTTFDWNNDPLLVDPPAPGFEFTVGNFQPTGACATTIVESAGRVFFDDDGTAESVGGVDFEIDASIFGLCFYDAHLDGTWTASPPPGGDYVDISGTATRVYGFPPVCPSSPTIHITVQSF